MKHNLETVKLKLRAFNTHRAKLEDVFKELGGFEKTLREQKLFLDTASPNHDVCCPICLEKGELLKINQILGEVSESDR